MKSDRTVHAWNRAGVQVVRYDRSGKWYIEYPAESLIPAQRVTIAQAVERAMRCWYHEDGSVELFRPGGGRFDYLIQQAVRKREGGTA